MSSFSVQALRDKFSRLSGSQESIETLSLWIIHHKADAATTVSVWFEDIKSSLTDLDHLLLLLYVANDVLQNGRRRGADVFHELFKQPLKEVFKLVRGTTLRPNVMRMVRVWRERKVYSGPFISELTAALNEKDEPGRSTMATISMAADNQLDPGFTCKALETVVSVMEKLESELAIRSSNVQNFKVDVTDPSVLTRLKDKSEGGRFAQEIRHIAHKLDDYCDTLVLDVQKRVDLVSMLIECRLANSRKLPACRQLLMDYEELYKKANSLHHQLEARVVELQRAQSTAATDLSQAKSDIQEVGDMELDSSDEEEEEEEGKGQPDAASTSAENSAKTHAEQAPPVAPMPQSSQPLLVGLPSPALSSIPVSPMMGPQPPSLFASPLPPLPMPVPQMGFPLPPMPVPPMQAPPMQGPPMHPPPMQPLPMPLPPMPVPPMHGPPMQVLPMQAPPLQSPPMQAPPMQAPPMSFPLTLAPLPPKTEAHTPQAQQSAGSEPPPTAQEKETAEKKAATLDERLSDIMKKRTQLRDKLWNPQNNDEENQKQTAQQSSMGEATLASLPKQTTTVSDGVEQSKPKVTFDTNALRALLGAQQKSLQPSSPSQQSLQSRIGKETKSDDITLKVGNALVKTVSTQESLKKVLDLWMKRDEDVDKKAGLQEGVTQDGEPANQPVSPGRRLQGQRRPEYDELSPRAPPPFHERAPPPRERPWGRGHSPPPAFAPHGCPPHPFPPDEPPLSPRGRMWRGRPPHPLPYRECPPRPDPWDFPPDGRIPPGIPPRGGTQDKWQMGSPPEVNQGTVKPFSPSADEEWRKGSFEPNDMMQEPPNRMPVPHDLSEVSSSEHHWQVSHREGTTMNEEEYNGEEDTGWDYSETRFDSHGPPEEDEPPYEGDRGAGEVQSQEYRHHEFSRRTPPPSWHPIQTHPQHYSEDTFPPDWHPRPHWGREQPHWRHAPPPRRSPPRPYGPPHPPMRRSPPMDYHRGPPPPRVFERRPPPQPWFAGGKRSPGWLPPIPPKRAPL